MNLILNLLPQAESKPSANIATRNTVDPFLPTRLKFGCRVFKLTTGSHKKDHPHSLKQVLLKIQKNMGLLSAIGNGARRARLNGEIVMVDREMAARKRAFGIELYDIIALQNKRDKNNLLKTPGIFKNIENSIRGPLESCSREIGLMEIERKSLENEAEIIEAKQEVDVNGGLGKRLSAGAREGKIAVKIAMINRDIRIRKEQFGTEIWDKVSEPQWLHETISSETKKGKGIGGAVTGAIGGITKGVKGTVGKTLGKVSGDEREIEVCLNKAKGDISFMEENKKRKQKEIDRLSGSTEPK